MVKVQIVSSKKFIFKEKNFNNVIIIFIYEGEVSTIISLKELVNFIKRNLSRRQIIVYPCFSRGWRLEKAVLNIALRLHTMLTESGMKVDFIYPNYERSFILIPSSNRYLILEAEVKYNQR
ncbi:MAG: hypothetical protein DRJ38_09820 [Thermoprotei archaeon]|nr:MAG: hypothetical protein DRJ38_09820 [Thermoprotei archaeon]